MLIGRRPPPQSAMVKPAEAEADKIEHKKKEEEDRESGYVYVGR
jgi:hypothetical protein